MFIGAAALSNVVGPSTLGKFSCYHLWVIEFSRIHFPWCPGGMDFFI